MVWETDSGKRSLKNQFYWKSILDQDTIVPGKMSLFYFQKEEMKL